MGNTHVSNTHNTGKKIIGQDEVVNGNGVVATMRDPSTVPVATAKLNSVADLTELQKRLLQESWKRLEKDIAQVGIIVFINLFESHPDMQSVFLPFTGLVLEDLKKSKLLREHALRVMGAVQRAVFRLQEPEKLHAFLSELGRKHEKNGAKLEYIDYIGPQFLSAIRPSLGEEWTPEMAEAWKLLLGYMTTTMKNSLIEARNVSSSPPLNPAVSLNIPTAPSSSSSSSTPAAADE